MEAALRDSKLKSSEQRSAAGGVRPTPGRSLLPPCEPQQGTKARLPVPLHRPVPRSPASSFSPAFRPLRLWESASQGAVPADLPQASRLLVTLSLWFPANGRKREETGRKCGFLSRGRGSKFPSSPARSLRKEPQPASKKCICDARLTWDILFIPKATSSQAAWTAAQEKVMKRRPLR